MSGRKVFMMLCLCCLMGAGAAQAQTGSEEPPYQQETPDSLSEEEKEIIQNLSLLEIMEYLEEEDIDFLETYDSLEEWSKNEDEDYE